MDEYISRKRASEQIHAVGGTGAKPDTWADGYDKGVDVAYRIVKALPAADVRPVVRGEWRRCLDGLELQCTACTATFWNETKGAGPKFCPECGADMRGGGEEAEKDDLPWYMKLFNPELLKAAEKGGGENA